ncbi:hypothetical protein K5E_26490 [Enterococcus thailandicus]|uniref:hypothetical protein n=1 Tax=Enterococcus TaxID=1350 RepID=UPI00094D2550|nr:hypothetical protein [Enterococcus thailandicus]MDT2752021.1 hypothetical protein [Enterococcus thailandicus]MDT2777101.1 hypothetical protein [Enterococcus thailandicus]GMC04171.1 hypothetical protein K4E_17090 [Enterococcus thailandicus]GMC10510.1 hypothetical protein K5E_26490 [Enterococcus thailandicus]
MNLNNLNSVMGAINILWGIYNTKKTNSLSSTQKYASRLIEKIFIPFYENIECNLFVNITIENKNEVIDHLTRLHRTLVKEKLLFYISDNLLIPLESLVQTKNKSIKPKKLNKMYQKFSKNYYNELNRTRKIIGLRPRTPDFRIHHKLYRFRIQTYIWSNLEYIVVFAFILFQSIRGIYLLFKK